MNKSYSTGGDFSYSDIIMLSAAYSKDDYRLNYDNTFNITKNGTFIAEMIVNTPQTKYTDQYVTSQIYKNGVIQSSIKDIIEGPFVSSYGYNKKLYIVSCEEGDQIRAVFNFTGNSYASQHLTIFVP